MSASSLRANLPEYFREAETLFPGDPRARRFEAETLIAAALGLERVALYVEDRPLTPADRQRVVAFFARREAHEPLQYILGRAFFRDLTLRVGPGVLVPRPETEGLVQWVLDTLPPAARVLDIGTGSGAIALSIAAEAPDASVVGVDLSEDALRYARQNHRAAGVANVAFVRADLLSAFRDASFDRIVSNPPYVSETEYANLAEEVRAFEPRAALLSGADGLDAVRAIVRAAPDILKPDGRLFLEIGSEQGDAVKTLLRDSGRFDAVEIREDQFARVRYAMGRKNA